MLTEAIWYMLTRNQAFAPASPLPALWPPDDPCLNWASRSLPIDLLLHPGGGKEMSPTDWPDNPGSTLETGSSS